VVLSTSLVESEYSIAAVSKLTGVSCHALRVWERRYGFPLPSRSAAGHRRYGLDQVVTLRKLIAYVQQGRAISDVVADFKAGKIVVEADTPSPSNDHEGDDPLLSPFLEHVLNGDIISADELFEQLGERLGIEELIVKVIAPAFTETGERWFRRRCDIYQERFISVYLRRKLDSMIEGARASNSSAARIVVIGTVQGDRHEGGILMANLLMERRGWRVINLGVDLPVREYAKAVARIHPHALALSFVLSRNVNKRFEELSQIKDVPVFVGGRSILNYQSLARRYGLIPLPGSIESAIALMGQELALRTPQ